MTTNRRVFFKKLAFCTISLAVLPTIVRGSESSIFRVLYTVTGNSDEKIEDFLKMQDATGVSANNRKLKADGLILNKTAYKKISDCKWGCTLDFKSKKAYRDFLSSSRSIIDQVEEFKRSHNINIQFIAIA